MKVILSKPIEMATISFKADDKLKKKLEIIAESKGINTSAYIKLILTKGVNSDLSELTENGLTVAEEMAILDSDATEKAEGPFTGVGSALKALKSK